MASTNPLTGAMGLGQSDWHAQYTDPFNTLAAQAAPRNMADALRWAQSIFMIDGTFAQAISRVVSYFITDVEVRSPSTAGSKSLSKDEKQKYEQFLRKKLKIATLLNDVGQDFLAMGVSFNSVVMPIRRYLYCASCPGTQYPLKKVALTPEFKFSWSNFEFHATCPQCGLASAWKHVDRRGDEESSIVIKRWNPHEIEILHDQFSNRRAYIWKIPEEYRKQIREGKVFHLEEAPWEVIQAIKSGDNFLFEPGVIFALINEPLAAVVTNGWGLALSITNYRQAWHAQMLRRYNEAICTEFLVPFRVISPQSKGGDPTTDPVFSGNLRNFATETRSMIRRHRRDPGQIQVSPFAVEYQLLGGEANQLAPFQLIDQATDALLNASGVPAELYKGTLTIQAAPAALRLFESHWSWLVDELNSFLQYVVETIGKLLGWEPVDCSLETVRTADDLNRQMAKLQLMMSGQLSQQSGLKALGANFQQEQDQLIEEKEYVDKKTQEMQDYESGIAQMNQMAGSLTGPGGQYGQQAAQAQGGQQSAQGGGGGGGGGAQGPEQIEDQASQIAQQLQAMPESQRKSELTSIKGQSPVLHAVVKEKLEDQKSQQGQGQPGQQPGTPQAQGQPKLARAGVGPYPARSLRLPIDFSIAGLVMA